MNEIYHNTKEEYANQIHSILISQIEDLNLTRSPSAPLSYYSYDSKKNEIRIIRRDQEIDTIIQLPRVTDSYLFRWQASYDTREFKLWNLNNLSKKLDTTFKSQKLIPLYTLVLKDQHGNTLDSLHQGKSSHVFWAIQEELDLGFLEHHQLKAEFIYPVYHAWEDGWDRIITTLALFFLLILAASSLYIQLRAERRTSESRKKFTHTLVHDLRSPLLLLKLRLETINPDKISSETLKQDLDNLQQKTLEVLKDIEKLLAISVNAYGLVANREVFDLQKIINKLLLDYQQDTPDKKVTLTVYCPDVFLIYADPTLVAGALGNLIGNAVKYSGTNVHIILRCQQEKHKVIISVKDNGFGIPAKDQPFIFQENYRGEHYKKDRTRKGFGLGLYYVQAVVTAHHGHISVVSDGESGSEFIIELPSQKHCHG